MVFCTCGELILGQVDPILRNEQKKPPELFYKKRCRNSAKFAGEHLRTGKHFLVNFPKFLGLPFLQDISG